MENKKPLQYSMKNPFHFEAKRFFTSIYFAQSKRRNNLLFKIEIQKIKI